jgi:membrane-associated phospholipid phosphatase
MDDSAKASASAVHQPDHAPDNFEFSQPPAGEPWCEALVRDAKSIATYRNACVLTGAAAVAVGLHQDVDGEVRENTGRHPERWGATGETLGYLGHPAVQVPAIVAVYGYGRLADDAGACDLSETLASAYLLNLGATTGLKLLVDTDRPDDDEFDGSYGFPSFHTSSAFTIAAVLDERYGWPAGVPAYALAGAVGWTRIDQRDHDVSDVAFAAALGYVIGKSVAARREESARFQLVPFTEPSSQASGVLLETRY